ncbi:MAG: SDR family oxidoreductase [Acidimicrobiia bacterium]|nr:SDR family oxidoreductase [Acidimicrobiia bacterium]
MANLTGKTVIVTGAAQGIGAKYAASLARDGANVVVADLAAEAADNVAEAIRSTGANAVAVAVDVADQDSANAMAAAAVDAFGTIDGLVNNAAIYHDMELDALISVDWDYLQRFMSVNMFGALVCSRAVIGPMRDAGGGSIVNQSSTASWMYSGFYGLAKVGVNGITQQLAHELGHSAIRVNAIAPGPIDTAATRKVVPESMVQPMVAALAIKRLGTPEDLTGLCSFLLSDESSWLTGQIINVDGGQVLRG